MVTTSSSCTRTGRRRNRSTQRFSTPLSSRGLGLAGERQRGVVVDKLQGRGAVVAPVRPKLRRQSTARLTPRSGRRGPQSRRTIKSHSGRVGQVGRLQLFDGSALGVGVVGTAVPVQR